jgi:NADH-quinone oxidoreductase subunit L
MTAFYMFRLTNLTFFGKERFDHHHVHPHESPPVMTVPLMILAVLSVFGGFLGIPEIFSGEGGNAIKNWLYPVFKDANMKLHAHASHSHFEELLLMGLSVAGAALSIYFARYVYINKPEIAANTAAKFKGAYNLLFNKYFVDEAYDKAVVTPILKGSEKVLWKFTDTGIIDGLINGTAKLIGKISDYIRTVQTGVTQMYAVVMMIGIVITFLWIILSF